MGGSLARPAYTVAPTVADTSRARHLAGAGERPLGGAGGIDAPPAERAEVVAFLRAGDCGVGVGGVTAAGAHPRDARGEIGLEDDAVERHAERRCGLLA